MLPGRKAEKILKQIWIRRQHHGRNRGGYSMSRRGENIYKRKDGRWEGRILRGHAPDQRPMYTYVYGHTYKEVKNKILEAGQLPAKRKIITVRLTERTPFSEAAQQWIDSKRSRVKESTLAHYQNLIDSHMNPKLGKLLLQDLDNNLIGRYTEGLLQRQEVVRALPKICAPRVRPPRRAAALNKPRQRLTQPRTAC